MNTILLINQSDLGTFPIAILTSEKWCSSTFLTSSKSWCLWHLATLSFSKAGSSALHFSYSDLNLSGTSSSQPTPSRHSSCRICLPPKMNGATKPRGSNTELTDDRIPLQPRGLSCIVILNWSVSDSMHQWTPRALSTAVSLLMRQWSFVSVAWSSSGTDFTTSLLFEVNMFSRKPPFWHRDLVFLINSLACFTDGTYFSPSST